MSLLAAPCCMSPPHRWLLDSAWGVQGFYQSASVVADMSCLAPIADSRILSTVCRDVADHFPDVQARVREDTPRGVRTIGFNAQL